MSTFAASVAVNRVKQKLNATILASLGSLAIGDGSFIVTGATITAGGSGYGSPPSVTFSAAPSGGVTATGTAVISGGVVVAITITNQGAGYLLAPTITFGSGAATATALVSDDQITNDQGIILALNNAKDIRFRQVFGWRGKFTATWQQTQAWSPFDGPGSSPAFQPINTYLIVTGATIGSGGSGYGTTPPTVTFSPPASGVTAQGHAVLSGGVVVQIVMDNPGYGYTSAPTITFGSGAATATAVTAADPTPTLDSGAVLWWPVTVSWPDGQTGVPTPLKFFGEQSLRLFDPSYEYTQTANAQTPPTNYYRKDRKGLGIYPCPLAASTVVTVEGWAVPPDIVADTDTINWIDLADIQLLVVDAACEIIEKNLTDAQIGARLGEIKQEQVTLLAAYRAQLPAALTQPGAPFGTPPAELLTAAAGAAQQQGQG